MFVCYPFCFCKKLLAYFWSLKREKLFWPFQGLVQEKPAWPLYKKLSLVVSRSDHNNFNLKVYSISCTFWTLLLPTYYVSNISKVPLGFTCVILWESDHGLRTPREEIAFTARPKIHSHSQIFRYDVGSIFCPPHRPKFSDIFDLCLHWVSVVRVSNHHNISSWRMAFSNLQDNRASYVMYYAFRP